MTWPESGERMDNARSTRRGPLEPVQIWISFDGKEEISNASGTGPVELTIEATDSHGELANWLRDDFWTEVIGRWADAPCTIHVAPTTGAMLHPVVLHQVEMLRRVTPSWRIVAHGYAEDVATNGDVDLVVESGYHELRMRDGRRPGTPAADLQAHGRSVEALFGQIRRHQVRRGSSTPVLVLLPAEHPRTVHQPLNTNTIPGGVPTVHHR